MSEEMEGGVEEVGGFSFLVFQPSTVDLVGYGSHVEDEKERLLQSVCTPPTIDLIYNVFTYH